MGLLRILGVVVVLGVDTGRYLVGHDAHLFHDVDLTALRPGVRVPVVAYGHHPEGRPCTLTLRQFDAGFEIAVGPTFLHLRIDAAGVDLTVLLETMDA